MCVSTGHLIQQIQTLACILYLTVVGKSFEYFMSKSALFLYLPSTLNNCMTKGILLNHFKVAWKSLTLSLLLTDIESRCPWGRQVRSTGQLPGVKVCTDYVWMWSRAALKKNMHTQQNPSLDEQRGGKETWKIRIDTFVALFSTTYKFYKKHKITILTTWQDCKSAGKQCD